MVDLAAGEVVVGVIEGVAVRLKALCAEDGVVEDALHAVSIAAVGGDAQQVARELEVGVAAAGRLEAAVRVGEALVHFAAAGSGEAFVRPPSAGGKALRGD